MRKYRWFLLRMNQSLPQAVKRLKAASLTEERSFGFLVVPREDRLPGRFALRHLTRTSIRLRVIDAEGQENEQEIPTVESLSIELFESESATWLCVENPPRSLRELLNNIEMVLGWGLSITPVVFPLESQRRALAKTDEWKMVAFKGLGSSPKDKAIARFEVASKEGVEPEKLDFLADLEFKVEQATYEAVKSMLRGQVAFAASGLVRFAGPLHPFLVQAVERQLLIAARRGSD